MGKQLFYRQLEMGLDGAYQLAAETMACNMMAHDAAGRHRCLHAEAQAGVEGLLKALKKSAPATRRYRA
jgi:hypothetical protein